MAYDCFQSDGNQAAMILTNLETGDTIGVCGEHVADWALSLLCAVTGVTWAPETDTATDPGTGDATDDPEAGDGPTVPAPAVEGDDLDVTHEPDDDDQGDDPDDGELSDVEDGVGNVVPRAKLRAARG